MRTRTFQALRSLRSPSCSSRPHVSTPSISPHQTASVATSYKRAPVKPTPYKSAAASSTSSAYKPASSSSSPSSSSSTYKPAQSPATAATPSATTTKPTPQAPISIPPYSGQALPEVPSSYSDPGATAAAALATPAASANTNGNGNGEPINWGESYHGIGSMPFSPEVAATLMQPIKPEDIEIKPDGILYMPEIKYRRILNFAFGPGAWGLAPRGELVIGEKIVTREYALIAHGRFVAQARGECQYFSAETIPTAGEGCKSNALMRCCKDLGIASELWDPRFIRSYKKAHAREVWVEHVATKKRRQIWMLKDGEVAYPYKLAKYVPSSGSGGGAPTAI